MFRWADTDDGLCDLPGLAFGRCSFRGISIAFTMSFVLLCSLHALLILAARRLPRSLESVEHSPVPLSGEVRTVHSQGDVKRDAAGRPHENVRYCPGHH